MKPGKVTMRMELTGGLPMLIGALMLMVCGTAAAAAPEEVDPEEDPASTWKSYMSLGAQLTPDYKEDGRSSGLNKKQLFAQIVADGKFGRRCDSSNDCPYLFKGYAPFHAGVSLTLLGTAVSRQAGEDGSSLTPKEFDDVAQTIVASGYLFAPIHESSTNVIGPILRASAISRETLKQSGDSVGWAYSLGMQYMFEGYRDGKSEAWNGIPAGYVRLSAARYEDYGGLGKRTRLVAEAAKQIYSPLGFYLGILGNFGRGPDELGVVFTFVRKPAEIVDFLKLGKKTEPEAQDAK